MKRCYADARILFTFFAVSAASSLFSYIGTSYDPAHTLLKVPTACNGSTSFSLTGSETRGHFAYAANEHKVPFFEQYGTIQAKNLLTGLDTPTSGTLAYKYLHASGSESILSKDAILRFDDPQNRYEFRSLHATVTQHLFTGIFMQCHAQLVEQTLQQVASAQGTDAADSRIKNFLLDLDGILKEYNLPSLKEHKRAASIERLAFLLGWSGRTTLTKSIVQEIEGSISGGYIITPPSFTNKLSPAALPHNVSDGFLCRFTLDAQIATYLTAHIDASTVVYNRRKGITHVVKDDTEGNSWYAGPILVGTGNVKKDPGNLWNLHAQLGVNRLGGLFALAGYHFAYQEKTVLTINDTTTLRGSGWSGTKLYDLPALQNKRLNSDPRLCSWKNHALTLTAGFEPKARTYKAIPRVEFSIHIPFMGHNSISPTTSYSGGGRLAFQWKL